MSEPVYGIGEGLWMMMLGAVVGANVDLQLRGEHATPWSSALWRLLRFSTISK